MDRSIRAGISGALLAILIYLFSPVYLDFIPTFLVSIVFIYLYGLRSSKEGLLASFMTYILYEGVVNTIDLAIIYSGNQTYSLTVNLYILVSPVLTAGSTVIAGLLGAWLVRKTKGAEPEAQRPPPMPEPLPPI